MKRIILFFMFIFSTNFVGQSVTGNGKMTTETRQIAQNYKAIFLKSSFDVVLTDNPQGEVRIEAEENLIPLVICEVSGSELVVKWKSDFNIITKKGVKVFVPFQQVEGIKLIGSGDVWTNDLITAENFSVALEGSGDIDLNIKAQNLQVDLKGSGDIDLSGTAHQVTFSVFGSGDISATQLISQNAKVSIFGSGDVELTAQNSFSGEIFGSGDISVEGKPKEIHQKIMGSGDIDFD